MTGSTLHTVSRLMSPWEDEGIVRSGRQKVTVVEARLGRGRIRDRTRGPSRRAFWH